MAELHSPKIADTAAATAIQRRHLQATYTCRAHTVEAAALNAEVRKPPPKRAHVPRRGVHDPPRAHGGDTPLRPVRAVPLYRLCTIGLHDGALR